MYGPEATVLGLYIQPINFHTGYNSRLGSEVKILNPYLLTVFGKI
jgi:hypothetical protein